MKDDIELLDDFDTSESIPLKAEKSISVKKNSSLLKENIKLLIRKTIFIVLLFYILFFHIFGITRIEDCSMAPNIAAGDLLFYYRLDRVFHVGDLVTFQKENERYHLRVVAIGGQTVSVSATGDFLVDNELELHQTYFKTEIPEDSSISYPYKVPEGKVFVVGDYRIKSEDSRKFGAIDEKMIDGKVISLVQTKDI